MTDTAFHHAALLYDDVDEAAARIAGIAVAELDADAAVLLCTPPAITESVRAFVGADDDRFVTIAAGARYERPIDAMSLLWRTTMDLLQRGARRVHSIGEITFGGGPSDAEWMWYEAAADQVLRGLPLSATCLYDAESSGAVLAMVHGTHPEVCCGETRSTSPAYDPAGCRYPAPELPPPAVAPDIRLASVRTAADARAAVVAGAEALHDELPADVVERARLVATELVANAILYAGDTASLALWLGPGRISLCVDDRGPGIADQFATLRPPSWSDHGRGLWITHHAASALSVSARSGGGTRAVAIVD